MTESSTPQEKANAEAPRRSRPPAPPDAFEESAWIGRVIDDRYRVESLLGEGGMGAVFLAEHVKLQKKIALKIILPQFAGNGEVAERFAREAMASAKLEHPHVASALDYGTLPEGGAYLVMQYARGPSLRKSLLTPRGWRYAADVGAQIADALSAAHAAGIVHRDLKPENVVLEPREDGTELVRVLDFGIARVLDSGEAAASVTKLTRVGTIIGTPGYMAPEQALGEPVDTRADLYALGVILWEITAGRELFNETEVTALVTRQLTTVPPLLRTIHGDVPVELEDVVARLLARDRNERPEKAGEVRDVLRRLAYAANMERLSQSSPSWQIPASATSQTALHISSIAGASPQQSALSHAATITGSHAQLSTGSFAGGAASAAPARTTLFTPGHPFYENRRYVVIAMAVAGALALLLGTLTLSMCAGSAAPAQPVVLVPTGPADESVMGPEPTSIPSGLEPPQLTAIVIEPIPENVAVDFDTLLHDDVRTARRSAAERILAQPQSAMPSVVRLVAAFEDESSCTERRDILESIVALHDPRVLPALQRVSDSPRRGCGFIGSQDCYRCLRAPLRTALEELQ